MDSKMFKKVAITVIYVVIGIIAYGVLVRGKAGFVPFLYFTAIVGMFLSRKHAPKFLFIAICTPFLEICILVFLAWIKPEAMPEFTKIISGAWFYSKHTTYAIYAFWCIIPVLAFKIAEQWGIETSK